MLQITVPAGERFNEATNEFIVTKEETLTLEHSLLSLAKWESKWHKSYLSGKDIKPEEMLDYVRCMTINKVSDPEIYNLLSRENMAAIQAYIENPMTATTFSNKKGRRDKSIITAEIIYYWMVSFGIPFECEKWHLNRLLTLIQVCSIKNEPSKKMSKRDIYKRNSALNAARRAKMGTTG